MPRGWAPSLFFGCPVNPSGRARLCGILGRVAARGWRRGSLQVGTWRLGRGIPGGEDASISRGRASSSQGHDVAPSVTEVAQGDQLLLGSWLVIWRNGVPLEARWWPLLMEDWALGGGCSPVGLGEWTSCC